MPDAEQNEAEKTEAAQTELESEIRDTIAAKVEAADLAPLNAETPEEVEDPGEIIAAVIEGDMSPAEISDAIAEWTAAVIDIPFIGEAAEKRLLGAVIEAVESAVLLVLKRLS